MASVSFLNQQDLQHFLTPPDEYLPERQANLTIEQIVAADAPVMAGFREASLVGIEACTSSGRHGRET